MGIPGIGQWVNLQKVVRDVEQTTSIYKTRVADLDEKYLALEMPVNEETGEMGEFLPETKISLWYVDGIGSQFQFLTQVLGYKEENITLILVGIPTKEEINRQQKRKHLRINAQLDLAIQMVKGNRNYHFTAQTIDIGGGGISFSSTLDYQFEKGDLLQLWMVLPSKSLGLQHIQFEGEVVRTQPFLDQDHQQSISIKYTDVKETDLQKLVRFCYEKQIELREKGLV